MSLVAVGRRARCKAVSPKPYSVVSAVVQRWDGASGSTLVSSTIPFAPGAIPTTGDLAFVRVWVDGVEQAIHLSALRGRHNDGSIRAALCQFTYAIPNASPIAADVWIGDPRGRATADVPSATAVTASQVLNPRALVITDAEYLCASWITLQPLIPERAWTQEEVRMYKTTFDTAITNHIDPWWNEFNVATGTNVPGRLGWHGTATYSTPSAFWTAWCTSGDPQHYYRGCRAVSDVFENDLKPALTSASQIPEWRGMFWRDVGLGYLMTGNVDYWTYTGTYLYDSGGSFLGGGVYSAVEATVKAGHISPADGGMRYNLRSKWSLIPAVCIDAKSTTFARQPTYATELPWIIDSYVLSASNFTGAECLDGVTGQSDQHVDGNGFSDGSFWPLFWLSTVNTWYLDYYNNVHADSRIPGLIKTNLDVLIAQLTITGGVALQAYNATCPKGTGTGNELLMMHANAAAFCAAFYDTGGSTTYGDLYGYCIRNGNVDASPTGGAPLDTSNCWKYTGEVWGWSRSGPYYRAMGLPSVPSTIREPVTY